MLERMAALVALGAVLIAGCDGLPQAFGSPLGDDGCQYKKTWYSHQSVVCQSGSEYRCDDGQWKGSGIACAEHPLVTAKSCTSNGSSYSPGSARCQSGTEYRCDDGRWRSPARRPVSPDSKDPVTSPGRRFASNDGDGTRVVLRAYYSELTALPVPLVQGGLCTPRHAFARTAQHLLCCPYSVGEPWGSSVVRTVTCAIEPI
jgi:hypothetical protein